MHACTLKTKTDQPMHFRAALQRDFMHIYIFLDFAAYVTYFACTRVAGLCSRRSISPQKHRVCLQSQCQGLCTKPKCLKSCEVLFPAQTNGGDTVAQQHVFHTFRLFFPSCPLISNHIFFFPLRCRSNKNSFTRGLSYLCYA